MISVGKIESLLVMLLGSVKFSVQDYCDIETVDDGKNIITGDGSFASIVRFHGSKGILGEGEFNRLLDMVTQSLSVFLDHRGHQLQVVFRRDLDGRDLLIDNAVKQSAVARKLQLDVGDLIEENVERYGEYIYEEECYLVLWSRPSLLDPVEGKISQEQANEFRAATNWPAMRDAQNLLRPVAFLRDRHSTFVTKVVSDLCSPQFNLYAELLDVSDALRAVRKSVYPDLTDRKWSPALPGTKIGFRWKTNDRQSDLSEFFYPRIAEQLMTASVDIGSKKNPMIPDPSTLRVGSRVYAPMVMTHPPREPEYFTSLFAALNRADTSENGRARSMPFVLSIMLEGDGFQGTAIKSMLSGLMSFTSEQNRNINLSMSALRERKRDGETIVKLRIAAMTWADYNEGGVRELRLRKSKVLRALEGWGKCTMSERTGYPMDAFQSCCVGLTPTHVAKACPAPLRDGMGMLPLTRPASPFPNGSTTFRSRDGKPQFYQRFSSDQTTWISLYAGKPGSGKSVLMNALNFEACLLPGNIRLPYIGIIDVGISSAGFIDLVREGLPDDQKHLAVYKRLQNATRDCINPLDTPLTLRRPLPRGRTFSANFVTLLVTPPEREGKPFEGMASFVGRVIDVAYKYKDDSYESSRPAQYRPGHSAVIDAGVERLRLHIRPASTYWELVDAFFAAEMYREAELAQRMAVPTLDDLVAVASGEEIRSEYGENLTEGNRGMIQTFVTGVREAIGDFPVFSGETRFDIGTARVMSLDMQDVAIIGSLQAEKQTSLMFMIGRESFMKKVAFAREDLPFVPALSKSYYERLIGEIIDESKVLCMDEFHKSGGNPILKKQVLTDCRESRKWKMEIALASQLMADFGEEIVNNATSWWILDAGTADTRKWMKDKMGLTAVEEQALIGYVHGPKEDGATFLARFLTTSGTFSQLFTMTAGARRLWALSTTAEDRALRTLIYDAMPQVDARTLLAETFPKGSCKKHVERLKQEQFGDTEFVDDQMQSSVIERLAKTMIDSYYASRAINPKRALSAH